MMFKCLICVHPPPLPPLLSRCCSYPLSNLGERNSTCSLVDGCSTLIRYRKKKIIEENTLWLNVILRDKERKMSYILNYPLLSPFYRVVCTRRVYNTVLWWFSWWYLYFCKHFGDPVISGFYKPRLFLKLTLPLVSFLVFYFLNCCRHQMRSYDGWCLSCSRSFTDNYITLHYSNFDVRLWI